MPPPQFEVLPPGPPNQEPPKRKGGILGALGAVGVILVKFFGPLLILLKTGGSMLLSIGAYSLIYGWRFAVGFVLLIFVHEMGHFVAAKFYRVPVTAPMFIPFFGAYVMLSAQHLNAWTNAIISYAGPLAGALGGWACYIVAVNNPDAKWLMAVALYTFILNLINLAPVPPLDGSKIFIGFSPRLTPELAPGDRLYLGLLVLILIALLFLGIYVTWGNLPAAARYHY
jgi:Zn-dependent protease